MAILIFNYIKRSKTSKIQAHKTLLYNEADKEETKRILFNAKGAMTEEEAFAAIDNAAKNVLFFRMKLSPDVKTENIGKTLDLWKLTDDLVTWLQEKLERDIPYIGAVHNNTDNPHAHVILLLERYGRERPITVEVIRELRALAAGKALDQAKDRKQMQPLVIQGKKRALFSPNHAVWSTAQPSRVYAKPLCPVCGDGKGIGIADTPDWCPACGRNLKPEYSEGVGLG